MTPSFGRWYDKLDEYDKVLADKMIELIDSLQDDMVPRVTKIVDRITMNLLGHEFRMRVDRDVKNKFGRIFLQVVYEAPCTKTGQVDTRNGRKWYLSEHMTDDEIVKTSYAAFKAAVEHEVMEGFKVDGTILFNPHADFRELLRVSGKEVKRNDAVNLELHKTGGVYLKPYPWGETY